jgi:fucose permease
MVNGQQDSHQKRLFAGICLALVPTGAAFLMIGNVLGQLKTEFILTNAEAGWIGGISVGAMAISLLVLGPLLEGYGLKKGVGIAFVSHILGLTCILSASGFTDPSNVHIGVGLLTFGSIVLAVGNGMIEVVGNPLVAALYPHNKAAKLNLWHGFFPLAIAGAGLLGFGLNYTKDIAGGIFFHWTFQLGIVYIPILVYGIMVLPLHFPKTENAEAGLPVKEMFKYTLTKPAMYGILFLMAIAISLELGTNRWIPDIFSVNIGIAYVGTLLLAWLSLVMFLLRFFASDYLINKLSPPLLLSLMSICTCLGLLLFSQVGGSTVTATFFAFVAATLFGAGIAFYFPTIVGLVSERMPRTGSLGIVLTCGVGLLAAGQVGQPTIGKIGDYELAGYLDANSQKETVALLQSVQETFPQYAEQAEQASSEELADLGYRAPDIQAAKGAADDALEHYNDENDLATNATAQALRAIKNAAGTTDGEQAKELVGNNATGSQSEISEFASEGPGHAAALAGGILGPAGGYAGQKALLWISWVPLILVVCFGAMYLRDKARGGYKAERLTAGGEAAPREDGSKQPAGVGAGDASSQQSHV